MNTIELKPFFDYPKGLSSYTAPSTLPNNHVWQAFLSGMKVLGRYAGRSNVDSDTIASSNLRLLHQTLLGDSSYRDLVASSRQKLSRKERAATVNLLYTSDLRANLICLHSGQSINPLSVTDCLTMNLVINGALEKINTNNSFSELDNISQRHSLWSFIRNGLENNTCLEGDTLLIRPNCDTSHQIKAKKQGAILLSVSLPIPGYH